MSRLSPSKLVEAFALDSFAFSDLFTARALGISLWIGLALLTISLLVLMQTRWGQAKPLSKCVVLSVFAHILLFGYAYGTKLMLDAPPLPMEEFVDLTFVDIDDEDTPFIDQEGESPDAPWDELAAESNESPIIEPLARPDDAPPTPLKRMTSEQQPQLEAAPPTDTLVMAEPERPVPKLADQELLQPKSPGAAAAEIAAPAPPEPVEIEALQPGGSPLDRLAAGAVAAESLRRATSEDVPREVVNPGARLQQLADVPTRQLGDAVTNDVDRTTQAANDGVADQQGRVHPGDAQGEDAPTSPSAAAFANDAPNDKHRSTNPSADLASVAAIAVSASVAASLPRRLGDGQIMPDVYRARMPNQRLSSAEQYGGGSHTESSVEAALAWLAANQNEDGRWASSEFGGGIESKVNGHDRRGAGADADTGITGLALLAFLGAGHTHLEGQYRKNVQHGLEFLLRQQRADGNLAGQARLFASMYCHGMASLAVSEAFVLTGDHRLKPYVERAIGYTVSAQHKGSGGWRYQPGDQGDMSQFGWQVMALRSAEIGGIPTSDSTRRLMKKFVDSVTSGQNRGLASYRKGEQASRTMTAEALVCRFFLDLERSSGAIDEATGFVLDELPDAGTPNLYYWYYATLALFQVQGDRWRQWNDALQDRLLTLQRTNGPEAGSWDAQTVWGGYGGRVYSTAMATLCLEVYYRYLPLYQGP